MEHPKNSSCLGHYKRSHQVRVVPVTDPSVPGIDPPGDYTGGSYILSGDEGPEPLGETDFPVYPRSPGSERLLTHAHASGERGLPDDD